MEASGKALVVALLQMDCQEQQRAENRATVVAAAAEAARCGADVLTLPELWASGYDLAAAVRVDDWQLEFELLADLSRQHALAVVGGSLLEQDDGGFSNCSVAYQGGEERARFRKLHLFGLLKEDRFLRAGPGVTPPFVMAGVRIGLAICYDLRFPELFRALSASGVDVVVVPAQWPRARIAHWRALLVARAIENQCFVIGVNRCGWFGDLEFPGHSLVVDPWGGIVLDAGEAPGLQVAELDLGALTAARRGLPVLGDRRTDLFS